MGELWVVLAVSCGLAYVSEKYTLSWNKHGDRILDNGIVLLLILYLSLFAGLRTGYNDTFTYVSGYNRIAPFPDILAGISWKLGNNPGFMLVNSLLKAAGARGQTFVLFYSTLFISVTICFLKRYSKSFTLSVFLFVCVNGFLFSMAAIKQCTAIAIGLLAIPLIQKRRWIIYALLIFLASTFHPYVLMFLIIPFLSFRPWSGNTWVLFALTALSARFLPRIIGTAVDVAALLGDGYDAEAFIGEGVNIFRVLVTSVPILLTLVFRRNVVNKKTAMIDYIFINLSFVYACIMFIGLFGTANYFGRLANYFVVFPAIALPFIIKRLSRNDKRFFTIGMIIGYLAFFYYGNGISYSFENAFSRVTLWQYLQAGM